MIRHTLFSRLLFLALCLGLAGCDKPIIVSSVQPDGSLIILGPGEHFARDFESGKWSRSGDIGPASLVVTEKASKKALLFPPGDSEYTILRPVDAILLSTPYLGWSWLLEPTEAEAPDISLLVGFLSPQGTDKDASFDTLPEAADKTPANRAFELRWAASALQRGNLSALAPEGKDLPRYMVRGGRENMGQWWREGVDLSNIYSRLWPGEDPARTRIVFVAIRAGKNRIDAPAFFADVRLFR